MKKKTRSSKTAKHVLLTGATGFVGKVVLEELTRRRAELGIDSIYVLVRPRKDRDARHRFEKSIADSECFARRTDDWQRVCIPVACELTQADCGIGADDLAAITANVTHVIHCAASVDFDLPIADAASSNITAALEVLSLAQRCKRLVNMVSVSTAYVSLRREGPIDEVLQELPRPAADIYREILEGNADERALLRETGHPNTYTVTKCMAEHLLVERRGRVPLTIVRPSIVAACRKLPFPGWIDSLAGLAGFVALCGTGHLRTLAGVPDARPDFVPCDYVSNRIVEAAFPAKPPKTHIRYAVAGQRNAQTIREHCDQIVGWFRRHPVDRTPRLDHVSPRRSLRFLLEEARMHVVPTRAARAWFALTGQKAAERAAVAVAERLGFLNSAFVYFSSNTFDFRSKKVPGSPELRFDAKDYCELTCAGVNRHLLKRDESAVPLAGRAHRSANDILWSATQPAGNATIRTLAATMKKVFRQSTSEITFDRASFKAAIDSLPPGTRLALLPNHRSYADFILVSYLAFARPELGIPIPHIAAAEEFSRIPLLGKVFAMGGAFYIKRGMGKADPQLTATVHGLVAKGKTIEFFVEGQRSRSRQFLPPRTGLLRCLQGTGEKFALLPIAISYDRIPEEASLLRELRGAPRPPMKLSGLVGGIRQLTRGELSYGRIHISCGEPVMLSPHSDVRQVGGLVMGELQANTFVSTWHLRCFLAKNDLPGVSLAWLRRQIELRGGKVFESALRGDDVDAAAERCMRYHWMHWFYADARAAWGEHPVLEHHIRNNSYAELPRPPKDALADDRLVALLRALFEPIARDYGTVAAKLGSPEWAPRHPSPRSFLHENPKAHLPDVQAAFADLVDREILGFDELEGGHVWGPRAGELGAYREACELPAPNGGTNLPLVIPAAATSADEPAAVVLAQREVGT